jgi:hypothetical protein
MANVTSNETDTQELCTGKFEVLKQYFTGIDKSDMSSFEEGYFEDIVPAQHKALMHLFFKKNHSLVLASPPQHSKSNRIRLLYLGGGECLYVDCQRKLSSALFDSA